MPLRWSFLSAFALSSILAGACAPPDDPEAWPEDPAPTDPRSTLPVDSWDDFESLASPVAIEWSFTELQGSWGDLALPLKVVPTWGEPLEADVFAFTFTPGVDEDFESEVPLWSGSLVAGDTLELSVPTESLPALTPGRPLELRVVARVFDPDGHALAIDGAARLVELLPDQQTVLARPRERYETIEDALIDASRAYIGTPYLESPTSPELAAARDAAGPYGIDVTTRLCPKWRVKYEDNRGATFINAAQHQRVPASFAKIVVSTPWDTLSPNPMGTFVDEGWLDADGCIEMTLAAGPYVMAVQTQLKRGEQEIDLEWDHDNVRTQDPPEDFDPSFSAAAFRVGGSGDIHRVTGNNDRVTRAAAVGSLALAAPDLPYSGTSKLHVYANTRCQSWNSAACGSETQIHVGDTHGGVDMTEFRNVIAHEFGHAMQYRGSRAYNADYATPFDMDLPEVCTCEHITPTTSHCLQSLEDHGAAFAEGFAHFVAARLFNTDPSGCEYQYYKPLWWTPLIVGQPPLYTTSCDLEIQWEQTRDCSHDGYSIEYDWLNFLWDLNHGGAEERWTVQELHDLFDSSCTIDLVTFRCDLTWPWLEAAVDASSVSAAKKTAFHDAAAAHGLAE